MLKEPENIVIVNLLGLKEIYMTLPLVHNIKAEIPGSTVTMVINNNLKNVAEMALGIDEFFFFEKEEIANRLSDSTYSLIDNYKFIKSHLSHLISTNYDVVINITNNRIGGIITSMLNAETIKGLTFDEYGYKWIEEPWFNYLNDTASGYDYNLFHYMDIFFCGAGYFIPREKVSILNISLQNNTDKNLKNIFIDLHENEKSADLLSSLSKNLKEYKIITSNGPDAYSEIQTAELVISSNYSTSILASLMDVKVIHLSSEKDMDFIKYGPYGENNFVLISDNYDGERLAEIIKNGISNCNYPVWTSRFDSEGFIEYIPYLPTALTLKDLYKWIYKSIWKNTLGRRIRAGDPRRFLAIGEKYIDRVVDIDREIEYLVLNVISKYDKTSINSVIQEADASSIKIEKLKNLAFSGQKAAKDFLATVSIPGRELDEIKNSKKRIKDIDDAIFSLVEGADFLAPLVNSFKSARADLHVRNLFPLAKSIIMTFEDLFSRTSFMHEIVKGLSRKSRRL